MRVWDRRPIEIRNLFNPAFCGLVLFRAMVAFEEEDERGLPFSLVPLILPICLHKQSREILAPSTRSYFLKLVANHPQLLVGFGGRAQDMLPFTFEALGLLHHLGAIPSAVRRALERQPARGAQVDNGLGGDSIDPEGR
ncbi:three component ABC system middle component [Methylosinus trichosporium]|uniref:three component ABC system middle component n=1 Tax=Methylosinus trichosporium TaxID=426 RepID=UPI00237C438E|nr:three component ABC system middle component [Methylosinus trichosporium]